MPAPEILCALGRDPATVRDVAAPSDPHIARTILSEVNRALGGRFQLARTLEGGFQSHTWLLADDARRRAVLKWNPERSWAPQILRADDAVARIRAHGYPTPAWLTSGVSQDGFGYQVHEFVPGRPAGPVTADLAAMLITVLESHADLDPDPDRCWSAYVENVVTEQRTRILREVSGLRPGGPDLVASCERLLTAAGSVDLPRGDLVHGDFRPGNIILHRGRINGVIDIEAIGSGSRVYDYATLLSAEGIEPGAEQMIISAGERVAGPNVLALCFAEVALSLALFAHRGTPAQRTRLLEGLSRRVEALTP